MSWFMVPLIHAAVGLDSPIVGELRGMMGPVAFDRITAAYACDFDRRGANFHTIHWQAGHYVAAPLQEMLLNPPQQGLQGASFIRHDVWQRLVVWSASANQLFGIGVPQLGLPPAMLVGPVDSLLRAAQG